MLKVMRKYLLSREFMKYATKLFISLMLLQILTCIDCFFLSRFLLCHWKHHWIASNSIRIVYTENVLLLISNQIVKQVSLLPWYYYFYAWKMPIYALHYSLNCPKSWICTCLLLKHCLLIRAIDFNDSSLQVKTIMFKFQISNTTKAWYKHY